MYAFIHSFMRSCVSSYGRAFASLYTKMGGILALRPLAAQKIERSNGDTGT